jgi:hypothetical protein
MQISLEKGMFSMAGVYEKAFIVSRKRLRGLKTCRNPHLKNRFRDGFIEYHLLNPQANPRTGALICGLYLLGVYDTVGLRKIGKKQLRPASGIKNMGRQILFGEKTDYLVSFTINGKE